MPLPIMKSAQRCRARAKSTQVQCQNPAAYGTSVCRLHGARHKDTIKRGVEHPNSVHGERTKVAEAEASQSAIRLREIEFIARAKGLLSGPRTRGRKPIKG